MRCNLVLILGDTLLCLGQALLQHVEIGRRQLPSPLGVFEGVERLLELRRDLRELVLCQVKKVLLLVGRLGHQAGPSCVSTRHKLNLDEPCRSRLPQRGNSRILRACGHPLSRYSADGGAAGSTGRPVPGRSSSSALCTSGALPRIASRTNVMWNADDRGEQAGGAAQAVRARPGRAVGGRHPRTTCCRRSTPKSTTRNRIGGIRPCVIWRASSTWSTSSSQVMSRVVATVRPRRRTRFALAYSDADFLLLARSALPRETDPALPLTAATPAIASLPRGAIGRIAISSDCGLRTAPARLGGGISSSTWMTRRVSSISALRVCELVERWISIEVNPSFLTTTEARTRCRGRDTSESSTAEESKTRARPATPVPLPRGWRGVVRSGG